MTVMFISTCPVPCQGLSQQQQGEPNTASSWIQNVRMLVSHVYIENGVHPKKAISLLRQRVWRPESLVLASWEPLTNWPRHHWRHPPHIGANHPCYLGSKSKYSYTFLLWFALWLKTSQELRMLSMSLSHEPWMSRWEFSNLSEIVNWVDSAAV